MADGDTVYVDELENEADVMLLYMKRLIGTSHDVMTPETVNCILQWLLMLMHCAGSTRVRAVELLRECLGKVPLECCLPTSLFSLARDLVRA